ncbi:MAG TPA: RNA polymerase sigma-70 factor, partial [Bacteroidales bacterium]|nr:RNA polymerase sigma-70 factor [Bacteroidales bacterium]
FMSTNDEKQLLERLQVGDKKAFSQIFSRFYRDLVLFAATFTKEQDSSEEIVQEVFVKLWELRDYIQITASLKSFLLKAVQNKCLDWLKHRKVKDNYSKIAIEISPLLENNTEDYILYSELQLHLEKALNSFPADIAEAFRLNRLHGLKYQDIAQKQGVSVRTIEVRMSKALLLLKEALKDYLMIIFSFCI